MNDKEVKVALLLFGFKETKDDRHKSWVMKRNREVVIHTPNAKDPFSYLGKHVSFYFNYNYKNVHILLEKL